MAFVVHEITGREGKEEEKPQFSLTRRYQVITDVLTATEGDILAASGLPALYEIHPANPASMVVSRTVRQSTDHAEPFSWEITITYSSNSRYRTDPASRNQDPTQRPAEIDVDFEEIQNGLLVELAADAEIPDNGWNSAPKKLTNSAKDPYDPPPAVEETIVIITVQKGFATLDFDLIMRLNNTSNLRPYTLLGHNFLTDELRLKLKFKRAFEQNKFYWALTAVFRGRLIYTAFTNPAQKFGGWQLTALDQGYRTQVGGVYTNFSDSFGASHGGQGLLNGNGDALGGNEDPKFGRYHTRKRADHSELKLF